jgi:hypothetical protein
MMMGGMIGFCKFESIRENGIVNIQEFMQKFSYFRIELTFIQLGWVFKFQHKLDPEYII